MHPCRLLAVLCLLLAVEMIPGCGTGSGPAAKADVLNVSGNWQIQTTAATPPTSGILLLGALASSGTSVSGTFKLADLSQQTTCGPLEQIITVSGTIDAQNNLALTSSAFDGSTLKIQLTVSPVATNFSAGTVEIDGPSCKAASAAALGVLFAPVNGTYAGAVLPGLIGSQASTGGGPASLTISQAILPAADGSFPLTANFTLTSGSCSIARTLSGSANGIGVNLAGFNAGNFDDLNIVAFPRPDATELQSVDVFFLNPPCAGSPTTFSGTLARQ